MSQTRKDRGRVTHFCDASKVARLTRAKNWTVTPGAGGGEARESVLRGCKVVSYKRKGSRGLLCSPVPTDHNTESCTEECVKRGDLELSVFPGTKENKREGFGWAPLLHAAFPPELLVSFLCLRFAQPQPQQTGPPFRDGLDLRATPSGLSGYPPGLS